MNSDVRKKRINVPCAILIIVIIITQKKNRASYIAVEKLSNIMRLLLHLNYYGYACIKNICSEYVVKASCFEFKDKLK